MSSARRPKRLYPASESAARRSSGDGKSIGSTVWMRKGSMIVRWGMCISTRGCRRRYPRTDPNRGPRRTPRVCRNPGLRHTPCVGALCVGPSPQFGRRRRTRHLAFSAMPIDDVRIAIVALVFGGLMGWGLATRADDRPAVLVSVVTALVVGVVAWIVGTPDSRTAVAGVSLTIGAGVGLLTAVVTYRRGGSSER